VKVLAAGWVLPVGAPPIRDGRVAVDDSGLIQWVGRAGDPDEPEGTLRELGDGVLLPGLVNAHCHLELSHLDGLAKKTNGFVSWVEAVVAQRASHDPGEVAQSLGEAIQRLVEETATVAIGDISNTLASVTPLSLSGLRSVVFHEVIGWDGARAAEVLKAADERWSRLDTGSASVRLALGAHAPHSVAPELFTAMKGHGGIATIHLAESPDETRFLKDGGGDWAGFLERRGLGHVAFRPPGVSPVRYLERLGVLHAGMVAAHAVHVDPVDTTILAQRGVFVACCPTSNRNLGVGQAPIPQLLRGGVRVCLGTDSLASGDSLDVAREMAEVHRAFPELPPRAIVRMGTAAGAAALGFNDLGTLAPGRRAALAFAAGPVPNDDPERFVVGGVAPLRRMALG
jgi:cytosine/adenosine deaminase-related metal-dependent hydrolase